MPFLGVLLPILLAVLVTVVKIALEARESRNSHSTEEGELKQLIAERKAAISKLSAVADFVEVSKHQRAIINAEKKLAAARQAREAQPKSTSVAQLWRSYAAYAAQASLVLAFWGRPIAALTLPSGWATPFGWLLALPDARAPMLSMATWSSVCFFVVGNAVHWLSKAFGLYAPPPPQSWMSSLMQRFLGT